ncbi:RES family NAD+ phosphorylase [Gangjinia marincola]|uniref:RES family NAD+ phosphorylase n=1 Tax=Gangjinia marincola TaxID=578463 RepID=A0ABN1MDG0_9FLAO
MQVFRIVRKKYHASLSASGVPNRWNRENEYVIYASQSRALCTLEMVAHRNALMAALDHYLLTISLPDDDSHYLDISAELPKEWKHFKNYNVLQRLGSAWYQAKTSLILKVPSVLIPGEFNYVINTTHADYEKVRITNAEPFVWDSRLL